MCQDFIDDRVRGRHSDKGRFVGVYKKFQKLVQFDNVYLLRSGDKKGFRVNRVIFSTTFGIVRLLSENPPKLFMLPQFL